MEMIIRMADNKYRRTGVKEKIPFDEAIETLIESIKQNSMTAPWQQWREEEMFTREVNLVLEANYSAIQQVYMLYS